MAPRPWLVLLLAVSLSGIPAPVSAETFTPGAAGIGDDYFPLDGNGGYDVTSYDLALAYDPATDELTGRTTIEAVATQGLSSFNLDFDGMTVDSVTVDGAAADVSRDDGELVIAPATGISGRARFRTVIAYHGVPLSMGDVPGIPGFTATADGALAIHQPHGASAWFPVNDHPSDKAAYTFRIRVPSGLQAIANGKLVGSSTSGGWTTWTWTDREPMASYLATVQIGRFDIHAYRSAGISYWDAIDSSLLGPVATPRGSYYAWTGQGDGAYRRLTKMIAVPEGGATMSFSVALSTEQHHDYVVVEAHHVGVDDWTTLRDKNGHTDTIYPQRACVRVLPVHPFLARYLHVDQETGACIPSGSTGSWHAASGPSDGYERWEVDLPAGALEVAIAYIADAGNQGIGAYVDDIVVSTGSVSTGFESGALSPWATAGPPDGSPADAGVWTATASTMPAPEGPLAQTLFARQPEIIATLEEAFGPYPFASAGAIADAWSGEFIFALENQTRSFYVRQVMGYDAATNQRGGFIAHETGHQWFGDSVALGRWQDIWLNEGFATYAEWLWSEHLGDGTVDEIFDLVIGSIPSDDHFWDLPIGDPGPVDLFDRAVYIRGGLAVHAIRRQIGDRAFFRAVKTWTRTRGGGSGTTGDFVSLVNRVSRQSIDELVARWLGAGYPVVAPATAAARSARARTTRSLSPAAARSLLVRLGLEEPRSSTGVRAPRATPHRGLTASRPTHSGVERASRLRRPMAVGPRR